MSEEKKLSPTTYLLRVISAIVIIIIGLLVIMTIILQPPVLDPFSSYPNSELLSSGENTSYPTDGLRDFRCEAIGLTVKKWQVFTTTDNPNQIHGFFSQQGQHIPKVQPEYNAYNRYARSDSIFSNIFCYTVIRARYFPSNVVIILDHQNTQDMNIIQQAFPNIASNLNVIITLQGYTPAE
jgi:hypothetical protein